MHERWNGVDRIWAREILLCVPFHVGLTSGSMLTFCILKYKNKSLGTESKLKQMNLTIFQMNIITALKKQTQN